MRDGAESALWPSQTTIDTALTGDPWATTWTVYCAGGITSRQFDLSPDIAEVRTFKDRYRLVGQECAPDPPGSSVTRPIPNSIGRVTIVTSGWGQQYSQRNNIPLPNMETFQGMAIS